ncbi:MAG: cyclic pyranopterin monophosphate synthase MoaC [Pelagibacteraceae bacterium]|nr:cyclic pyranopterin monophosphate synthase MoaC [Pelagibacteraceae bacterium]|tara:strand:+ start:45 stop:524 length:480 start_codon:yes stop_codon:yes gene_type:complete
MNKKNFTHLDKSKSPQSVDVSNKKASLRTASAQGIIKFNNKSFQKILNLKSKKGDIIGVAVIAGIMAAKKTSDLIPLCHNIPIDDVKIKILTQKSSNSFKLICSVKTFAKTGVEMEALTGVTIACLTIYDMCKSLDKKASVEEIKLLKKSGGKSGEFTT